jgi:hypothetical protein
LEISPESSQQFLLFRPGGWPLTPRSLALAERDAVHLLAAAMPGPAAACHLGKRKGEARYHLIPGFASTQEEWAHRSKAIRTSYNLDHDLNTETLTLVPGDERWLDFVYRVHAEAKLRRAESPVRWHRLTSRWERLTLGRCRR